MKNRRRHAARFGPVFEGQYAPADALPGKTRAAAPEGNTHQAPGAVPAPESADGEPGLPDGRHQGVGMGGGSVLDEALFPARFADTVTVVGRGLPLPASTIPADGSTTGSTGQGRGCGGAGGELRTDAAGAPVSRAGSPGEAGVGL
ncbi:hypothetical protein [Arthrobacter sp. CAN_C5]|uniref:hypothetical protein n=1 Tax=Arthrobacter sp. CAN_C5 TaxID=2760706 RepID=UPI001AEA402E|nr:hypothetical protein [Arthrobacter sp. CAN_C5]MBP2217029.1 hypothetical protein [Arthrobacter sp. CAN_C5]